jgi:hypothetical protein
MSGFDIASGLMGLGGLIGIGGSLLAAKSAERTAEYSADIMEYNTRYTNAKNKIREAQIDRELKKVVASQRAQTAASGIMADVGTPLELQIESAVLADIDKSLIRLAGGFENLNIMTNAQMTRSLGASEAFRYYGQATGQLIDLGGTMFERHGSEIKDALKRQT